MRPGIALFLENHCIKILNNNNNNDMKEIRILNGNITATIPVESNDDIIRYNKAIADIIGNKGILNIDGPTKTISYPYLFLANSVIEYPKFD